jgi:hypothetical protein
MADFIASPNGGMSEKGQVAEQPKVQDVVATEAAPEESTAAPAEEAASPESAEKATEAETAAASEDVAPKDSSQEEETDKDSE